MRSSNEPRIAGSTSPAEWLRGMNSKSLGLSAVALAAMFLAASGNAMAAVLNVYWTDRNSATLSATNVAGGGTQLLAQNFNRLQDVDLDSNTGTLYFSDWGPVGSPGGEGSINRIQTDGTGLGTVLNTGDAVHQLALDSGNQRLYFTRAVSYDNREISRVDYSGANYTILAQGTSAAPFGWFQSGLALDLVNSKLYWGDIGVINNPPNGTVNVMGLDGSSPTLLAAHLDGRGRGFALDQASQTIFLTEHDPSQPGIGGGLYSYDIGSGVLTQLISDTGTGYWDIEIDPFDQRIWWTDYGRGQIRSAKFDGTDVQVELSGLTNPYGLALEFVPEPSTWVLAGLGALGLLAVARRHRRARFRRIVGGPSLFCAISILAACNASAAPITVPTGLNAGDQYRLAFVTSIGRDATSSDIADYNAFVAAVAASQPELAALGTTWTAIASTATVDARDNTGTNPFVDGTGVPIYRLDDSRIVDDNLHLWSSPAVIPFYAPLNITETGDQLNSFVWTGSTNEGILSAPDGWLGGAGPLVAAGDSSAVDLNWLITFGVGDPIESFPLYAISGELTVVPEPGTGVLAFLAGVGLILVRLSRFGQIRSALRSVSVGILSLCLAISLVAAERATGTSIAVMDNAPDATVDVFNETGTSLGTLTGTGLVDIAFHPGAGVLYGIDNTTNQVIADTGSQFPASAFNEARIAVSPTGDVAVLPDSGGDTVNLFNASGTAIGTWTPLVDGQLRDIAYHPGTGVLFAVEDILDRVFFDSGVSFSTPIANRAKVTVSPTGDIAVLANDGLDTVSLFDSSGTVIGAWTPLFGGDIVDISYNLQSGVLLAVENTQDQVYFDTGNVFWVPGGIDSLAKISAVPEPSTLVLAGMAALGLLVVGASRARLRRVVVGMLLLCAVWACTPLGAHAEVIDFDTLIFADNQTHLFNSISEDGYTLTAERDGIQQIEKLGVVGTLSSNYKDSPSVWLTLASNPPTFAILAADSGSLFDAVSVDVATMLDFVLPQTVTFTGVKPDSSIVSQNFVSNSTALTTFSFGPSFEGLSALRWQTVSDGGFAVDNIVVSQVPEPSTLALAGIAAAGLLITAGRRLLCGGPTAVALAVLATLGVFAAPARAELFVDPSFTYTMTPGIEYGMAVDGDGDPVSLTLDLYQPTGPGLPAELPAIVLMHGGYYVGGDSGDMEFFANQFASRGWVAASINYRKLGLLPPPPGAPLPTVPISRQPDWLADQLIEWGVTLEQYLATFAAATADQAAAVNWLAANAAAYEVNPDWLAAGGYSAGAVSSLLLAGDIVDGASHAPLGAVFSLAGALFGWEDGAFSPASPSVYLIHGELDDVVPFSEMAFLQAELAGAGVPYETRFFPTADHTDPQLVITPFAFESEIYEFLIDELMAPQVPEPSTVVLAGMAALGLLVVGASRYRHARARRIGARLLLPA